MERCYRWLLGSLLLLTSLARADTFTITYYHNDITGSPIAATDESGQLLWRKTYSPYGEAKGNDLDNRRGYTGHVEDDNGLLYAGARYYSAKLGRFLSTDPAGFSESNLMSFNRYAYANNNPYKFVDPDGRVAFLAAIPWIVGAASAGLTGYEIGSAGYGLFSGNISPTDLAGDVGKEIAINTAIKAAPGGAAIAIAKKLGIDELVANKAKTLGANPFMEKSAEEIAEMLEKKGYTPMGRDPVNGAGTYVNSKTKRGYHIDASHPEPKGPHVGVHRPRGKRDVLKPRDYPLGDQ